MSNEVNERSELSLLDTWIAALTIPKVETFSAIAAQPSASAGRAFLWVFLAAVVSALIGAITQAFGAGQSLAGLQELLPPEIASEIPVGAAPSMGFGTAICSGGVGAVFAVAGFAVSVALIHWVAGMFGGAGSYEKLAYAFSAFMVPYYVITAVLSLFSIIPFVGILTGLINLGLFGYLVFLEVLAVQGVYRLEAGKAVGAVLLPGLVILLVFCCCIAIGLTLLGPAIAEVFETINQSLGVY